jgi:hypothetical protein
MKALRSVGIAVPYDDERARGPRLVPVGVAPVAARAEES